MFNPFIVKRLEKIELKKRVLDLPGHFSSHLGLALATPDKQPAMLMIK